VLDAFSTEKTTSSLWERLQDHYLKKLANQLILKQRLFLLRMHESTHIKSHIAEFSSIIIDLDKIEIKIEDEDQAFLLLYSLPFSYKNFKEADRSPILYIIIIFPYYLFNKLCYLIIFLSNYLQGLF